MKRPQSTTLWVSREWHTEFRKLVALTGLQSQILLDRLLKLGKCNLTQVLSVEAPGDDGVRATG